MTDTAPLPPLRRQVIVDADPNLAFTVFTERIGSWWPLGAFSVYGAGATVALRDGDIVESAEGQPDSVWGTITVWDPPAQLTFTWHAGAPPERATLVTVTFTPQGARTLVRLEHSGWEAYADPAAAREGYSTGWPTVLGCYAHAVAPETAAQPNLDPEPGAASKTDDDTEWTWVALLHRPAPDSGVSGAGVMADPRFADHVDFLKRMQDNGFLVAAGPLADEPGAGMTVLRLPGADRLDEARRLAEVDDRSVATGFFTVTVRPWHVVLSR